MTMIYVKAKAKGRQNDSFQFLNSFKTMENIVQERYSKLLEIHGQLQNQNSLLEERLLTLVEKSSAEKMHLEDELHKAKERIQHLEETVRELQNDKQRYKDDCQRAVQLLQQNRQDFLSTTDPPATPQNLIFPTFPPTFLTSFPTRSSSSSIPGLHNV